MSFYKYKQHDFFTINYSNKFKLSIDSLIPVDKIRITCGIQSGGNNPLMGILIYSDLVNNYIGTAQTNFIFQNGLNFYNDNLEPENGIEFMYEKKIRLLGEFNCSVVDFTGVSDVNSIPIVGYFSILIEYFAT